MTGLHFLTGREGAGKTGTLYARMAEHMRRGERAVLLVPEQQTYEAEKAIAGIAGGMLGIQVLSPERLCQRVLSAAGDERPYLTDSGVRMIIRRFAFRSGDALTALKGVSKRPGFPEEMLTILKTCKQSCVTPEELDRLSEELKENSRLSGLLKDIALLYGQVQSYLEEHYLTTEDAMEQAVRLLPDSFVKGLPVYADGIVPCGRTYRLLGALMETASSLTVALTLDDSPAGDADLFVRNREAKTVLSELAQARNVPVFSDVRLEGRREAKEALLHLERNLFCRKGGEDFPGDASSVTVIGAADRTAEVARILWQIEKLARSGIRYREMEIVVTDIGAYAGLLERQAASRGIPLFMETGRAGRSRAAVRLLIGSLRAAAGGYPQQEVLDVLKSGFAGVENGDADLFENEVLRRGIRFSMFLKPLFEEEEPTEEQQRLEAVRRALMEPLMELRTALEGETAGEKAAACYAYLERLQVREQLEAQRDALLMEGRVDRSQEHGQLWDGMVTVLEELYAILGDSPMSKQEFAAVLEEGLGEMTIGILPDTGDSVRVCSIPRGHGGTRRVLFVMGCSEGQLPKEQQDDGLLSEEDFSCMQKAGCPALPGADARWANERLMTYETLAGVTDALYLSYPYQEERGPLRRAALVERVEKLLPGCTRIDTLTESPLPPLCEREVKEEAARELRAFAQDGKTGERLPELLSYLQREMPELYRRLAEAGAEPEERLDPETAELLFGAANTVSVSRLEQFNECPYRHFLNYGLVVRERKEYEENSADWGELYHAALCAFFRRAAEQKTDVSRMLPEEQRNLLGEVLPELIASHNGGILLENERYRQGLFLLVNTLELCIAAIVRQLAAGNFKPAGTELVFGPGTRDLPPVELTLNNGKRVQLRGIVDRLDTAETENGVLYRVIDYKTRGKKFKEEDLENGTALQLPVYLAVAAGREGTVPAGMYYMPVSVSFEEEDESSDGKQEKAFSLYGKTLSEPQALYATDRDYAEHLTDDSSVAVGLRHKKGNGRAYNGEADREEMEHILTLAMEKSRETLQSIMDGVAAVSPLEEESSCKYCPYRSICRFDKSLPGCRERKPKKTKRKELST